MKKLLLISICFIFLITGCRSNNNNNENIDAPENILKDGGVTMSDIKVIINDKTYTLKLEDNETVSEFLKLLPQEFTMSELNGNEKYIYMNNHLTTNSYNPKYINAGAKSNSYTPTIEINGGYTTINMGRGDTDAVDSNGNIYVNGGTIDITAQSPFDYDGEAKYKAGTIIVNGKETNEITNQMIDGGMGRH